MRGGSRRDARHIGGHRFIRRNPARLNSECVARGEPHGAGDPKTLGRAFSHPVAELIPHGTPNSVDEPGFGTPRCGSCPRR
jgi:hypothetical protein